MEYEVIEEQESNKLNYPSKIKIKGNKEGYHLNLELVIDRQLQYFKLTDHVSSLERMLLKMFPTFTRLQNIMNYTLVLDQSGRTDEYKGRVLSEYLVVDKAKSEKKKRRRRGR